MIHRHKGLRPKAVKQIERGPTIRAQRAAKCDDFRLWWESNVPNDWLDPVTVPHSVLVGKAHPLMVDTLWPYPRFLRWFAEHQSEVATIRELVYEAESRYRNLLRLLHERTTAKVYGRKGSPMFTAWHGVHPLTSAFKVVWESPGKARDLNDVYHHLTRANHAYDIPGRKRHHFSHPWTPDQGTPFPWDSWWHAEGTSKEWDVALGKGYDMAKALEALFPGENVPHPHVPLLEITKRFSVWVTEVTPISMHGTWVKLKRPPILYRPIMRPSLVTLYLHPDEYKDL